MSALFAQFSAFSAILGCNKSSTFRVMAYLSYFAADSALTFRPNVVFC
ncbi:hypothetical protein [Paenibacillus roseipurpureus]|uniref:Uncharacterized protein n=1 Tax=Paenibacillus roseopurpureus TaxID=2918901 RepID=A0AA96LQ08_9BACL|nr:hypothetical protein [Paenibacillus sp. MBLB1832]WNR44516.1 hypothetical protein MJB10_26230 [Paenibacillus sp. MBLB1832]